MILFVLLLCHACHTGSKIGVVGQPCPGSQDHVHVPTDDARILAWYGSHHAPAIEVLG